MNAEDRIQKFRESAAKTIAVVYCVKCGSTLVDQNFVTQLKCVDCGNTFDGWDGNKFSVCRSGKGVNVGELYTGTDVDNYLKSPKRK